MELRFDVCGMTCAACSARVQKVTEKVAGVQKAEVNLLAGKMVVHADSDKVSEEIVTAVKDAGYDATIFGAKKQSVKIEKPNNHYMQKRIVNVTTRA